MTTNIYLEALSSDLQNRVNVTIETYVALFCHQYISDKSLKVHLIHTESTIVPKPSITIDITGISYVYLPESEYKNEIANLCNFPVLVTDENVVIAGLCGVCRGIIKHTDNDSIKYLLGFKSSCLLAPSEQSIWTRFCEIDFINCTKHLLELHNSNEFKNDHSFNIPEAFGRFEGHMAQPVRVHNVYKLARNLAKENLNKTKQLQQVNAMLENLNIDPMVNGQHQNGIKDKAPRTNKKKTKSNVSYSIFNNQKIGFSNINFIFSK